MTTPADWYPDPNDPGQWRYWDGSAWTDHYARKPPPPAPEPAAVAVQATVESTTIVAVFTDPPPTLQADSRLTLAEIVQHLNAQPSSHPLDEQVEIAGENHHVKDIKKVFRDHKMPITSGGVTIEDLVCVLVPERWNAYDTNAVAVMVGRHHVGYVPAEMARDYSPPLLRLASSGVLITGQARIWAQDESGMVRARVTALLPEASALT
jgi:hypothetical protein